MSFNNEKLYAAHLSALKDVDQSLRESVNLFNHSHILGTYDDEIGEPVDEYYYERKVSHDERSLKETLPF